MKKFLSVMLTAMSCLLLFACGDNPQKEVPVSKPMAFTYDTMIQDENGIDKCFWEDGRVSFDDYGYTGRQLRKSATLTLRNEYDLCLQDDGSLEFLNDCYPLDFEYDEEKLEIRENPENINHFFIKALQVCDKEEVVIHLLRKDLLVDKIDENGELHRLPLAQYIPFTVSTEDVHSDTSCPISEEEV